MAGLPRKGELFAVFADRVSRKIPVQWGKKILTTQTVNIKIRLLLYDKSNVICKRVWIPTRIPFYL